MHKHTFLYTLDGIAKLEKYMDRSNTRDSIEHHIDSQANN